MKVPPFVFVLLLACSSGPAFNDTMGGAYGSAEVESDREMDPCVLGGVNQPGWHHCHNRRFKDHQHVCCPDGMTCSQDSFVPPHDDPNHGFCRF